MRIKNQRFPSVVLASAIAVLLAACGSGGGGTTAAAAGGTSSTTSGGDGSTAGGGSGSGGGSSSGGGGSNTPTVSTGSVNMSVTDGPSDDFAHVWVTISKVAFHTDASAAWNSADTKWMVYPLPSPMTIDLAALNNGALSQLFSGFQLPVGTYQQIRFFLDGFDQSLDGSALAINDSNGKSLQWNDQVEYIDGSGNKIEAPLEIAYPSQGIAMNGTFSVTANSTLNLAVDYDLEHDVVPFNHNGSKYFTLKPNLKYFDLGKVAAITGKIDTSTLCNPIYGYGSLNKTCASRLIVKAEIPSADGSRYVDVRATTIKPDGGFSLYPLNTVDAKGIPLKYHVLIRGRNMETMVVQNVTVVAGTTPSSNPSVLQSTPISLPVLTGNGYFAQFSTALSPLTSGHVIFQQTDASVGKPYEVRWANTDPFTGKLWAPEPLENAGLKTAAYNGGGALTWAEATVAEGAGNYGAITNAAAYYDVSDPATVTKMSAGNTQYFAPNSPSIGIGLQIGTIMTNISVGTPGKYAYGQLVLSRFGRIIATQDISSSLSSVSGSPSFSGIPAGSPANPVPGAYYYLYARLWGNGNPIKLVPVLQWADLRSTNSATVSLATP